MEAVWRHNFRFLLSDYEDEIVFSLLHIRTSKDSRNPNTVVDEVDKLEIKVADLITWASGTEDQTFSSRQFGSGHDTALKVQCMFFPKEAGAECPLPEANVQGQGQPAWPLLSDSQRLAIESQFHEAFEALVSDPNFKYVAKEADPAR